jgi:hypothetical protein
MNVSNRLRSVAFASHHKGTGIVLQSSSACSSPLGLRLSVFILPHLVLSSSGSDDSFGQPTPTLGSRHPRSRRPVDPSPNPDSQTLKPNQSTKETPRQRKRGLTGGTVNLPNLKQYTDTLKQFKTPPSSLGVPRFASESFLRTISFSRVEVSLGLEVSLESEADAVLVIAAGLSGEGLVPPEFDLDLLFLFLP